MAMASASMAAASTAIDGSRMRSAKSSIDRVRSVEVKFRSTPFWVATCRLTEDSVVSWADRVAPVRTWYWFGSRIFRLSPILAPSLAKESSYSRTIEPTKFSFWCRTNSALRVTCVGVRRVLAIDEGSLRPQRSPLALVGVEVSGAAAADQRGAAGAGLVRGSGAPGDRMFSVQMTAGGRPVP